MHNTYFSMTHIQKFCGTSDITINEPRELLLKIIPMSL